MAMKPSLTLRLGQQLRMTPQLQQAIKLLQLSTLDLQQEIQEALDSNLMLEELSRDEDQTHEKAAEQTLEDYDTSDAGQSEDSRLASAEDDGNENDSEADSIELYDPELDGDYQQDTSEQLTSETISEELPIDSVWEDVWDETPPMNSQSGAGGDSERGFASEF